MCVRSKKTETRFEGWRNRKYQSKAWLVVPLPRKSIKRYSYGSIDLLEQRLEDFKASSNAQESARSSTGANPADLQGCLYHASLLIANHLKEATESETTNGGHYPRSSTLCSNQPVNCLRPAVTGASESSELTYDGNFPRKKRRLNSYGAYKPSYDAPAPADALPGQKIIDAVITKYFETIHHWLPMVHERRLRARLEDEEESKNLHILIHSMIAATLRHINHGEVEMDSEDVETQVRLSTDVVMLHALNGKSHSEFTALKTADPLS